MRKRLYTLFVSASISILLVSCHSNNAEEDLRAMEDEKEAAIQMAEEFVRKMYTISHDAIDINQPVKLIEHEELLSSYLTEGAYADLKEEEMNDLVQIVHDRNANLTVDEFQIVDTKRKENEIILYFHFIVQMDEVDERSEEEISGEMMIESIGGEHLQIARYYDQFEDYF